MMFLLLSICISIIELFTPPLSLFTRHNSRKIGIKTPSALKAMRKLRKLRFVNMSIPFAQNPYLNKINVRYHVCVPCARDLGLISVRILLLFGLFPGFHSDICPNSSLIRTVSRIPLGYLSEFFSYSDRFQDSTRLSVRILLLFGPFPGFYSPICPNSSLIRTVSRISLSYLSEFFSFSDRFQDSTRLSVRILLLFGPFPGFYSPICPNSSPIRTVSRILLSYLSEFFSYSDRFQD